MDLYGISQTHLFCLCRFWACDCSNGYSVSISNKTMTNEYNCPIVICCAYVNIVIFSNNNTYFFCNSAH